MPARHPAVRRRPLLRGGLAGAVATTTGMVIPAAAQQGWGIAPASAAETGPLTGLLVTGAATAEGGLASGNAGATPDSLLVQFWLENRAGQDLTGVTVRASILPRAMVADSWVAQPGQGRASVENGALVWNGVAIRVGERSGPYSYRLAPQQGADGAVIFREPVIQPEITWAAAGAQPAGKAATFPLKLNGLWGETGQRRTILPTGLTVLTRERPDTASVAFNMSVRVGSRDEDDTTWGGSHWLEHAHFLGTARRPNNQAIFGDIDEVGGDINASTSHEFTSYHNLVPADQFDLGLDVLADQLLNSTFPQEAFDRERRVVFEELKRDSDSPARRATDEFFRTVFQVSPLRRDAGGYVETVATIPIQTILAHRERFYVTGNMAIAAIGNLRHETAVAKIAQAFAALPRGPQSPRPPAPEPVETTIRRLDLGDGTRVAEIRLGWPVPGDDKQDSVALELLQDVLGSIGRRLAAEIRDRRALVPGIGVSNNTFSDAGAFLINATATPANVDAVIEAVLEQIRAVRDGAITDEEVQASRRARAGQRALAQELNDAQSGISSIEVSGVLDSYAEYLARLAPVAAADVVRVARTYLDPASYTLVIVRS